MKLDFLSGSPGYTSVSQEDEGINQTTNETCDEKHSDPSTSTKSLFARAGALLALLTIAVLCGVFISDLAGARKGDNVYWKTCGDSITQAQEHDCVFDVMLNGWVRPECHDPELSEKYLSEINNLRFYTDEKSGREIPLEEYRQGMHYRVWTSIDHHLSHCSLMWHLQALSLVNNTPIDENSLNLPHTLHCAQTLLHSDQAREDLGQYRSPILILNGFLPCRFANA